MPELPEVQTVVNTLAPRAIGARIGAVLLQRDDIVAPAGANLVAHLTNRTIQSLDRRGKRIVFTLDDKRRFYIHLGMTGRLTLDSPVKPLPKHTHFILELTPARGSGRANQLLELRFCDPRRFGGVFWLGTDDPAGTMGPEPLTVDPEALFQLLHRTRRHIKSALLDQSILAGLGNIYVDEALHAAKIHPRTRAQRLSRLQVRDLTRAIKQVLRRALRHRGSTLRDYVDADGKKGGFQKLHRVYDRTGLPCLGCNHPIRRIVLGGRSTHFCPTCQPARAQRTPK